MAGEDKIIVAKKLSELKAVVHIARYPAESQDAIKAGRLGTVNLQSAQDTLIEEFQEDLPTLGKNLHVNRYDPEDFRILMSRFRVARVANQTLAIDLANQAVEKNDLGVLHRFPGRVPSKAAPEPINLSSQPKPSTRLQSQSLPPPPSSPTDMGQAETTQIRQAKFVRMPAEQPMAEETQPQEQEQQQEQKQHAQQEQPQEQQQNREEPANQSQQSQQNVPRRRSLRDMFRNRQGAGEAARRLASSRTTPPPSALSGAANAASNYWGLRDLARLGQWAANKLGLQGLSNLFNRLFGLEKLAGQGLRGLANLGAQLGRQALSALARGAMNILSRLALQAALAAARTLLMALGGAIIAIVTTALFWWIVVIVVVVGFSIWSIFDAYSECSQPGRVELTKSADKTTISEGENINYRISVVYKLKCAGATIDAIVEDRIPSNTTYVPDSAKSTVPEFNGQFYSDVAGPMGEFVNNSLVWRFTNLPANAPAKITFSITPNGTNTWVVNQASIRYSRKSAPQTTDSGFPPTQDNCGGKYSLKNPLGNFGDPECGFQKDDLLILLEQQDPKNALFWFYNVVRCESGYNPNSWRDPNITPKTPDPAGAWGLYQMGRGRNGPYDRGDVPWQQQTINAVTYARGIPSIGAYWACAR